jgi:hypothetical protein
MTTKGAIRTAAVVYSLRLLLSIARASLAHRLASAGVVDAGLRERIARAYLAWP